MRRLINSKRHSLATVVSNIIFDFIKQNTSFNVQMYKVYKGIGFAWKKPNCTYEIEVTTKEIEVEKKLPGGTVTYTEARFTEGVKLVEDTLKEIKKTF